MCYSSKLRRVVAVTIVSLFRLDEISAFVASSAAPSSATITQIATKGVLRQYPRRRQMEFYLIHDEGGNNNNSFLFDVASQIQHQFTKAFAVTAIFTTLLTSPISVHISTSAQHHINVERSQAWAITENQQFVADVWFAVSAQYYDTTYNGLGESGWRTKEQEAMNAVADTGPDDTDIVEGAIKNMLSALNDPYTRYLPKEKYAALTAYATNTLDENGSGGIGVQLLEDARTKHVMVMATTSGGPADLAGLQIGDIIVKIDGMDVSESSAELVAAKCRGLPGGKVDIDYLRITNDDGKRKDAETTRHVTLTRAKIQSNNDIQATTFQSTGGKTIGMIKVPSFTTDTVRQLVDELRRITTSSSTTPASSSPIDALVIDLRGNVGGYMPAGVDAAKLFLPARAHIIAEVGQSSSSIKTYDADGIGAELSLPLYVLVDARTASASEIFASALQDNRRAVIVGTTNTFGKGRIQNVQPLQDGSGIAVTRARYITPSGRDLHGVGIVPDAKPEQCEAKDAARTCLANIV
jgi:carboxyl-terminal processing protease